MSAFGGVCVRAGRENVSGCPGPAAARLCLCARSSAGACLEAAAPQGSLGIDYADLGALEPLNPACKEGEALWGWLSLCTTASPLWGAAGGGGRWCHCFGAAAEECNALLPLLLMALFLWWRLNDRLCLQRSPLGPCIAFSESAFHHASAAPWIRAACCCLCLASLAGRWSLTQPSWCRSLFCCSCTFPFPLGCQPWHRTSQGSSGTLNHWTPYSCALAAPLLSVLLFQTD